MRMQMEVPSSLEKTTIIGFATDPTRAFFANATKPDRNHTIRFIAALSMRTRAISFYAGRISLMPDPTIICGFGHKVKLACEWNQ